MDLGAEAYRRYLTGDDEGLLELVRLYRDSLLLFLNGYTHDPHAAEDLTEEVFLRLAVKKPHFSPRYSFKTWLFTIGRNMALSWLRRQRHTVPLDDTHVPAAAETAETLLLRQEERRALYRALSQLHTAQAEALYLTYFEGLSNAEAAKIMKKSKRQLENLLYRGKNRLKTLLTEQEAAS